MQPMAQLSDADAALPRLLRSDKKAPMPMHPHSASSHLRSTKTTAQRRASRSTSMTAEYYNGHIQPPPHQTTTISNNKQEAETTQPKKTISNRLIRPSSTPAHHSHHQNHSNDNNPTVELYHMRSENETLRHEIIRLQEKLVEKMRGTGKLIGGGQFRIASSSSSSCNQCTSLRTTLKKLQDDQLQHQRQITTLQEQLTEVTNQNKTLHETNQTHREVEERLHFQFHQMQQTHEKELQAFEKQLIIPQTHQSIQTFVHTSDASTQSENHQEQQATNEKMKQLEQENDVWKQRATENEAVWRATREEMNLEQQKFTRLKDLHTQKEHENDQKLQHLQKELVQLQKTIETQKHIGAVQQEELVLLEELNQRQSHEILEKEAAYDAEKQQNEQLQAIVEHLHARMRTLEAQLQVEKNQNQHQDTTEWEISIQQWKSRAMEAERQYQTALETKDQVDSTVFDLTMQLTQAQATILTQATEIKALEQEIRSISQAARDRQQQLSDKLAAVEYQAMDNAALVLQLRRSHAQVMEKTLQSFVRLCIVAPTVNVHVGAEAIVCKPPLPVDQVQRIVQTDVLARFTSLFVQDDEARGPEGELMDTWLHKLLQEMQQSIQLHLKQLYSPVS